MPKKNDAITLRITRRELATILAALRFHQDENLQAGGEIPGQDLRDIATGCGSFKPLGFDEVGGLCEKLNIGEGTTGLVIEPPHKENGDEPLHRVAYVIDVNAPGVLEAARQAHRIMIDPGSQPPVLKVLDHDGKIASIDLSKGPQRKRAQKERG